jgi:hypothetical protein
MNLSGLHAIDAFMRNINHMRFMKSGKSLAKNWSQGLDRLFSQKPSGGFSPVDQVRLETAKGVSTARPRRPVV